MSVGFAGDAGIVRNPTVSVNPEVLANEAVRIGQESLINPGLAGQHLRTDVQQLNPTDAQTLVNQVNVVEQRSGNQYQALLFTNPYTNTLDARLQPVMSQPAISQPVILPAGDRISQHHINRVATEINRGLLPQAQNELRGLIQQHPDQAQTAVDSVNNHNLVRGRYVVSLTRNLNGQLDVTIQPVNTLTNQQIYYRQPNIYRPDYQVQQYPTNYQIQQYPTNYHVQRYPATTATNTSTTSTTTGTGHRRHC